MNDVIGILFFYIANPIGRTLSHNGLLLCEIALTREDELVVNTLDFNQTGQVRHITADFLEIGGRDVDDG